MDTFSCISEMRNKSIIFVNRQCQLDIILPKKIDIKESHSDAKEDKEK